MEMWGRKWNLVIRGIGGEKDRIERPREAEVLVRAFLKKVISIAEDRAKNGSCRTNERDITSFELN